MSKRTQELAHDWFYNRPNRQGEPIREVNANGHCQMSYSYNEIWTYNVLLAKKDDVNRVLFLNDYSYSNTSTEHKRQVVEACPYFEEPIKVLHGLGYLMLKEEVEYAIYQIENILKKQLKARTKYYLNEIGPIVSNIEKMMEYLRNPKRTLYKHQKPLRKNHKLLNKMYELTKVGKDLESLKDYTSIIEAQKKRAKLEAKRQFKSQYKAKLEKHNQWYADSITKPTKLKEGHIGVYLKIIGDELHTSNHIKVNLKEATILYKKWTKGKNIIGLKLDDYTVVQSSNKRVKIGCTIISADELHKIFKDL